MYVKNLERQMQLINILFCNTYLPINNHLNSHTKTVAYLGISSLDFVSMLPLQTSS